MVDHGVNASADGAMLVTGGAGFIGSQFVRLARLRGHRVVVLDALTYAGRRENLAELETDSKVVFVEGRIGDRRLVPSILVEHRVQSIIHFAAESHVDNSISGPRVFAETNVLETLDLLESARHYWLSLSDAAKTGFRFVQVSTDEVFGSLGAEGLFSETTPYAPNSPYSASKAGSDHMARAWFHTYGLPVIITHCSNNYGPRQLPEKFIPRMILSGLNGLPLPIYGRGENIRDWIHVDDHCLGVDLALRKGRVGEHYCFGGQSERRNIDVAESICRLLDERRPLSGGRKYRDLITHVTDRLGHDYRYAIDDRRAQNELGFVRTHKSFEEGLRQTVDWYLSHLDWVKGVQLGPREVAL